ncbi:hypothetical protein CPB84DRAFT_1789529 [Gymnopilus junonius]|uniref:Uncharacterized protein n=1 Tax=Gymnopilus junonius TaxID=109634 RepID=A0A9P5TI78_GYMJU|nr:hypothetical protein CPB84DRAFT_1789529 [Gymnopilus junonius]
MSCDIHAAFQVADHSKRLLMISILAHSRNTRLGKASEIFGSFLIAKVSEVLNRENLKRNGVASYTHPSTRPDRKVKALGKWRLMPSSNPTLDCALTTRVRSVGALQFYHRYPFLSNPRLMQKRMIETMNDNELKHVRTLEWRTR